MDLMPLYDLRERLKAGAIAGSGLIAEDFRLTRALDSLAPLEAAAPVFARLGQSVRALLAPDCADRAGALLDSLSLCDAVLTTQAATEAGAPVEPLPITAKNAAIANAPYSVLSPLMEALTTSGSGRYSFVVETHEQRPDLFADYRVKYALVAALGASYAELADKVADWLSKEGPEILPLLKRGFDPKGKKEMARRVQVIDQIAGAAENSFYLSLLEDSEKEVRAAAVYALRHEESNAETLIALTKTEKGAVKKAAQRALSGLESPIVWDYWSALAIKKPEQVAEYMTLSTSARAGEWIGKALCAALEPMKTKGATLDKDSHQRLQQLLCALPGKSGPDIIRFYQDAAALGEALDQPASDTKRAFHFRRGDNYCYSEVYVFSAFIPAQLLCSLVLCPARELIDLAEQLWKTHGALYAPPAIVGALLARAQDEAYRFASPLLHPGFQLTGRKKEEKDALQTLCWVLEHLSQPSIGGPPVLSLYFPDPSAERDVTVSRPLAASLDPRWYLDMIGKDGGFDGFLIQRVWPEDVAVREALTKHFYDMCRKKTDNRQYLPALQALGWTNYDGFLRRFCEGCVRLDVWEIRRYLRDLPTSNQEKISELESLIPKIESGKIQMQKSQSAERLRDLIRELRDESAAAQ